MATFRDAAQFYDTIGELMLRAAKDATVGPKIAKSGLIIQFRYADPDAVQTIDTKSPPKPGTYVTVINGATTLKPDIEMSMSADTAHKFWSKKVNLMGAIGSGQIKIKGPLPKVLALLPAIDPLYAQYPKILQEKGYANLVLK